MNIPLSRCFFKFVLFTILTATLQAKDVWKEYVHKEQRMAFSMPGDPTYDEDTYSFTDGTIALSVSAKILPDKVVRDSSATKVLKEARDQFLHATGLKEVSEKEISANGSPGIEFQFKGGETHGVLRLYLAGTYLYQLMSLSHEGSPMSPETNRFLNSFRLIKP